MGSGIKYKKLPLVEYYPAEAATSEGLSLYSFPEEVAKLSVPLDFTTLFPIDAAAFTFDSDKHTLSIKTDVNLETPTFTFVLVDTLAEWPLVVPVTTFYIKMTDKPKVERNSAPTFVSQVVSGVLLNSCVNDPTKYWRYVLPDVQDSNGDEVLPIRVLIPSTLIDYSPENKTISQIGFEYNETSVELKIQLTDVKRAMKEYKIKVQFGCKAAKVAPLNDTKMPDKLKDALGAKIAAIDMKGLVTIAFL